MIKKIIMIHLLLSMIAFVIGLVSSFEEVVLAENNEQNGETMAGYLEVKTIIPDNQRDKSKTYFDLLMSPGAEQVIQVELKNTSSKENIVAVIQINDATTNNYGIVEYAKNEKRDSSLKVGISDIVKTDSEVVIPANQTKTLFVQITMPTEKLNGVLLGGIVIREEKQKEINEKNHTGPAVINQFAYTIGLLLTENEKPAEESLALRKVTIGKVNYRKFIKANIQNSQPVIMKDMTIEAKIYLKEGGKIFFTQSSENINMAPNSNFDYLVSMEKNEFPAGKYILEIKARSVEKEWTMEKEFTIVEREHKKLAKTTNGIEDISLWKLIFCILLPLFILWSIYWKNRIIK